MRVLGVDPGLVITGYGVLDTTDRKVKLVEAGTIDSGKSQDSLPVRLRRLHREMEELVTDHHPDVMALEQLYSHYEHPRTAILMGHARGVICLSAGLHDIPLFHYPPAQIKSALTGNGRASKDQIQHLVRRTFGLVETPNPPDVADAVAIALTHIYREAAPDARILGNYAR